MAGLIVFLVISPGLWASLGERGDDDSSFGDRLHCWGSIAARWFLTDQPADGSETEMAQRARTVCHNVPTFGSLLYRAEDVLELLSPFTLPPDTSLPHSVLEQVERDQSRCLDGRIGGFGQLLQYFLARTAVPLRIVHLSPSWIRSIFARRHHIFHAVAITQRVNRHRILGNVPSRAVLNTFKRSVGMVLAHGRQPRGNLRRRVPAPDAIPIEDIVDWLFATRHLKNAADVKASKDDFARVFSRDPAVRAQLRQDATHINPEVLRKARVRLDCMSMLLTRALMDHLDFSSVSMYLFVDGSPQWRGWELYATTLDVLHGDFTRRMLLPIVSLARSLLDRVGIPVPGCGK